MTASTARKTEALLPQHQALIEASGIAPEVAAARGYRSVQKKTELRSLGFGDRQCRVPALVIPVWGVTGEIATYQIRPDEPCVGEDGKPRKYETPRGSRMVLDVPPLARPWVADPDVPLFITEGARKADAAVSKGLCCVAVLGVWNWRGTNDLGGKVALPDWEVIALNGRLVYVCFDSDVMTKPQVHQALARLKAFLEQRGAKVRLIYLPPGAQSEKVGLDDYLAAGHSVEALLALASDEIRFPAQADTKESAAGPYHETEDGLVWLKHTRDGEILTPLTNFRSQIVSQVIEDDGAETRRLMEIEGRLKDRVSRFVIPVGEFAAMNWPLQHLGSEAVVYAGFGVRDHVRAAIQLLSGEAPERRVYTHTGWRQIGEVWCYLHAGGAIGPEGAVRGVEVKLPQALGSFILPEPPEPRRLREAVEASLRILDTAPEALTFPLFCAIWRAPVGPADFSLHLVGPTGAGKTEEAALAQRHWGAALDARHLPGSWSSTANALEGIAFAAQHALLVVDDFSPAGGSSEVAHMHREADRLLRGQGNRQGRLRMRADATLRPPKPPRGLIVSTGEDVPRGESLRARVFVIEMSPGDVDWHALTGCQDDAAKGLYAEALAGFVKWLAAKYDDVHSGQAKETRELRQAAMQSGSHRRTPDIVANLAVGLKRFLAFAEEAGALSDEQADALWERGWQALGEAARAQGHHQAAAEPANRFIELLRAVVSSGRGHVAGPDGGYPEAPERWGWRERVGGSGYEPAWVPQGHLVGWVDGENLYLEPEASLAAVQALARESGETLAIGKRTLHKRLHERRWLMSTEEKPRETLTVRRTLGGARRNVLHLHAHSIVSPTGETDQSDQPGTWEAPEALAVPARGQFAGQFSAPPCVKTDHETDQGERLKATVRGEEEPVGRELVSLVGCAEGRSKETASGICTQPRADSTQRPCYACQGTRFWRSRHGPLVCATCHPPAVVDLVAEWIEVSDDGKRSETVGAFVAQDGEVGR
jgi:hypothetical protein